MLKRRLSLLLILLISSQSVWAMLDIHQIQPSKLFITEHHTNHQHNYSSNDTSGHEHHCHGHSSPQHFLSGHVAVPLSNSTALLGSGYSSPITSAPLSNLFRPPRA